VWAHNTHIAEGAIGEDDSDTDETGGDPSLGAVTGTVLARALGEDLYTVGLTSFGGTTRMDGRPGDPTEAVPAPPADSLEAALHALGKPYLFVDLHGLPPGHRLRQPFTAGFVFYEPIASAWAKAYDGVLFIDSMRASTAWDKP
jgi:erythromycin esterase-like protein